MNELLEAIEALKNDSNYNFLIIEASNGDQTAVETLIREHNTLKNSTNQIEVNDLSFSLEAVNSIPYNILRG